MLALIVAGAGCAPDPASQDNARSTVTACDERETRVDSFAGQLTSVPNETPGVEDISRILRNLGEPPLYCDRADVDEEYRLWERDWERGAAFGFYVTVRATKRGEEHRIRAATNFDSKQPFEGQMTMSEWTRILEAIEPLGLWQPPPPLPTPPPIDPPTHESSYMLEGRKALAIAPCEWSSRICRSSRDSAA